jgi:hypothetical protein
MMAMIAVRVVRCAVIGEHSTAGGDQRQRWMTIWGHLCARTVDERWMTPKNLGIDEKFRG